MACSAPSHYLHQYWRIVNWTLANKLQWNSDQNIKLFWKEMHLKNVVCLMLHSRKSLLFWLMVRQSVKRSCSARFMNIKTHYIIVHKNRTSPPRHQWVNTHTSYNIPVQKHYKATRYTMEGSRVTVITVKPGGEPQVISYTNDGICHKRHHWYH